jgi:hypothetical protein
VFAAGKKKTLEERFPEDADTVDDRKFQRPFPVLQVKGNRENLRHQCKHLRPQSHRIIRASKVRVKHGQSIGIEASSNGDLRAAIRRQRTREENADRRTEDLAKASESGPLTEDLLETTRLLAQKRIRDVGP